MEKIKLSDITVHESLRVRVAIDDNLVRTYAEMYKAGDKFPPVVVFHDPEGVLWLADGFHRFKAHQLLQAEDIEAEVLKGTIRNARWHALRANRTHGKRLTEDDEYRVVAFLLQDEEWKEMSIKAIERETGIEWHRVKEYKTAILGTSEDRETVTVIRGDQKYKMNVGGIREKVAKTSLLDAVEFVKGAVAKKDFVPARTYFHIAGGRILAYDGALALSSPIDLDLSCSPKATQFITALKTLNEPVEVKAQLGMLELSHGGSSHSVSTVEGAFPDVGPEGETYDAPPDLLGTFDALKDFISGDASKPWSRGILFKGARAYATNSVIVVERTLSQPFPVTLNVPEEAVEQILRTREEPIRLQVGHASATFHFTGERWLRTALLSTEWPDVDKVLDTMDWDRLVPVPEGFFEALERLKGTSKHDPETVYLHEGFMSTNLKYHPGAREDVPGVGEWGYFNLKHLLSLNGAATSFDPSVYPKPCPFRHGDRLRGMIAGMSNGGPYDQGPPVLPPSEVKSPPPPPSPAIAKLAAILGSKLPPWGRTDSLSIDEAEAQWLVDKIRELWGYEALYIGPPPEDDGL